MSDNNYLIVFREHLLDPDGIHSGAEMATLYLARQLVAAGRSVVVAANLVGEERSAHGVEFWNVGPQFDISVTIERMQARGRYHLISAGRALPLLMARHSKGRQSSSLITHDRTSGDSGISSSTLAQNADTIFCVSEAQRQLFLKDGVDEAKLEVIHNGVDLELFRHSDPQERNYNRLIFVGATIVDKGIHLLVESFAKLKNNHPELTLDVYGKSSLWGRQEFLQTEELERSLPGLKFHGAVPQPVIAEAMRQAGVCVIPSIWFDPFPLVSIDAQACGCPIVAFDVGGLKEGIIDGVTGKIIPEVSEATLTAELDTLLKDQSALRQMSNQCVRRRDRFTWKKVGDKVIARCEKRNNGALLADSTVKPVRIGLMSTWNQDCGLATYASYLAAQFDPANLTILAEQINVAPTSPDEANVTRCWLRDTTDFTAVRSAIKTHKIELLYLNCHYRFFPEPAFASFLKDLRAEGVGVICHLHSTFTLDEKFEQLVKAVDAVVVHTAENRLEAIANGAGAENVFVVPHAVQRSPYADRSKSELRAGLNLPQDAQIISCFGFVQPHKGIEAMIEGIAYLKQRGLKAQGYVLGTCAPEDPNSKNYLASLKQLAHQLAVTADVNFLDRFLTNDEVSAYLSASDLVVMNYRSQHYEATGAGSLAVGSGRAVVASLAPAFQPFGDAVWHVSSGYPMPLSLELLLRNGELRAQVEQNGKRYSEENSWKVVHSMLSPVINRIAAERRKVVAQAKQVNVSRPAARQSRSGLRVLMQNRGNAFTHRGGDTVLMERTKQRLEQLGVAVTIDVQGAEDPAKYDLVHLFNFALPQMVQALGRLAESRKVPFVVTTLYEDVSSFHNQSLAVARQLLEYVQRGQNRSWLDANRLDIGSVQPSGGFDNSWAATNAACLLANGSRELNTLTRDYPNLSRAEIVPVGYEIPATGNADLFIKEYGIKDFVFCVGRLETRKNQLMLLKALEDSDLPVVLAAGGFSYQADYDQAVRMFRRRGKTLILDRLSPEILASAYAAARIHALPSWYELPGLVSLEAAFNERNVVVTAAGTAPDYFGDSATYCNPSNESSILQAVLAAYYSPAKAGLKEVAMKHSWDHAGEKTLEAYEKVLAPSAIAQQEAQAAPIIYDFGNGATDFQDLLERGELAAKSKEYAKAHELLAQAERLNSTSARLMRARGAVYLAQEEVEMARQYFERGVLIDPKNSKLQSGLGMCAIRRGDFHDAHKLFGKALDLAPQDLIAILQLIECSYRINDYSRLETALRRFLVDQPQETEMQYCLAGCLFKKGNIEEAAHIGSEVLKLRPDHLGAKQLLAAIEETKLGLAAASQSAPSTAGSAVPTPVIAKQSFDGTDQRLSEIEELKRKREYAVVRKQCEELIVSATASDDQKLSAKLILTEARVLMGEIAEAEATYDEVLAAHPNNARAMCGKGAISANRSDWQAAKKFFERAHELAPDYDVPWAGLGVCGYWNNDYETAWTSFSNAVQINPENVRALLGIIELGYPLKRLARVEEVIKNYLEMHPLDLEFLYSLAGCYFAQDKLQEAIEEVNKVTLFDPTNARAIELQEMIAAKVKQPAASARV